MENINFNILFILGVSIFGGLLGASLFQKLRIPQVVGYIVIGLIVGESGLKLVNHGTVTALQPFTLFALGIIGFLVGGELKGETFKQYAKQFFAILLGEGLGAFILVGFFSFLIMYVVFHNGLTALAAGIVFGAIASATDPASTIDVLWECRSLGILTTTITAIVALDDALAMMLYGVGTGLAEILTSHSGSIIARLKEVSLELLGAVLLGLICVVVLRFIMQRIHQPEKGLAFAVGLILLLIGISVYLKIDVILTTMTLGCSLTNVLPRRSKDLFKIMRNFSVPIYVLFFVLAGARLSISQMPDWLWSIVIVYVVGRSAGKMIGAYIGARFSGSAPAVRRYIGLGLFAQGGVAIGLSIMASHHLAGIMVDQNLALGDVIIFGVAATTFIVQLTGPPMVKVAVKLGGEVGRNVTREDVIDSWTVGDIMETDIVLIQESEPLIKAAQIFMQYDYLVYPVVDRHNNIIGVISLESLKHVLVHQDSWNWLVASDIMGTVKDKTYANMPLKDIVARMDELDIYQMPVVEKGNGNIPIGILDRAKIRKLIDKEIIRRQQPIKVEQDKARNSKKGDSTVKPPSAENGS